MLFIKMFQSCKTFCLNSVRLQTKAQLRCMSHINTVSKIEAKSARCQLFDEEKKRQRSELGRIEKIKIQCKTAGYKVDLVMNKNISTPYDCARHISEGLMKTSILALYNDMIWDMHDPLPDNGELQFLNILNPVHMEINKAYWRSCAFILGAVLDSAFKSKVQVHLYLFPPPLIQNGYFTHSAMIDLPHWVPTSAELTALTAEFVKLTQQNHEFEKLHVDEKIALEMFKDNPYKLHQIPQIMKKHRSVSLYRIGDHIDISRGPMIGNTYIIGRSTITAGYKVYRERHLYNFQGVSLPKGIELNSFAYGILEQSARSKKFLSRDSQSKQNRDCESINSASETAPKRIIITN